MYMYKVPTPPAVKMHYNYTSNSVKAHYHIKDMKILTAKCWQGVHWKCREFSIPVDEKAYNSICSLYV